MLILGGNQNKHHCSIYRGSVMLMEKQDLEAILLSIMMLIKKFQS